MLSLGRRGERRAAGFLKRLGMRIIERNYKAPTGEVDIIAMDGDTLVFVEVKARKGEGFGSPLEAVDLKKQKRITRAALFYMSNLREQPPARFDVIGIMLKGWRAEVEHIRDAFALEQ
jgi:putative endonuclease